MIAIVLTFFLWSTTADVLHLSSAQGTLIDQSTFQELYTYQSDNAVFQGIPAYVICSVCPEVTAKSLISLKPVITERQVKPLRIEIPEFTPHLYKSAGFTSGTTKSEIAEKSVLNLIQDQVEKEIIYFDFDSYRIRPSEKIKLDRIKSDKGGDYRTTGYTCDIGSKKYNDRLAFKRAEAVRDYLGVKAEVIGKGKCCYLDPENRSKNRRVEVEIKRQNDKVQNLK